VKAVSVIAMALLSIAGSAGLALLPDTAGKSAIQANPQEEKRQEEKKQDTAPRIDRNSPEAIARRDFMLTKLLFMQNALGGLTTGDMLEVASAAKEIGEITKASKWVSIDDEQFRKYEAEFQVAAQRLIEAAKTDSIDAATLRFQMLTTSCIDCHKYIRGIHYDL
jgi:cytochrome c556